MVSRLMFYCTPQAIFCKKSSKQSALLNPPCVLQGMSSGLSQCVANTSRTMLLTKQLDLSEFGRCKLLRPHTAEP